MSVDILILDDEDKKPEADEVLEDETPASLDDGESEHKITKNSDGTVTLTLKHPFRVKYQRGDKVREEEVKELRFRRPAGGDFIAIEGIKGGDVRTAAELICRLIGKPLAFFNRIDGYDLAGCGEVLEGFFPKPRKTSKT